MVTRRGYGTHQRPVALCAWAGLVKTKFCAIVLFRKSDNAALYFHPAHGGELYALTSIDVW